MKTIKTMMKPLLALILLLAIAPCALPTSRAANAAYREKIASLAQDSDVVCENETLRFEVGQVLAVDDFTALTWRVTNLTDKAIFISTSEFFAAFSGIEYDVCGGAHWDSLVLAPGESASARFHGTLWSHFEPGQGEFTLDMKLYALVREEDTHAL